MNINPQIKIVCQFLDKWSKENGIDYTIVSDEPDLQGVMIISRKKSIISRLLAEISEVAADAKVHVSTKKSRNGIIITISTKALSETKLLAIAEAGETMDFENKINNVFDRELATPAPTVETTVKYTPNTFLMSAIKIVDEGQYKSATRGASRANQTSLQRQRIGSDHTLAGPHDTEDPQATTIPTQAATGPTSRFVDKIAEALGVKPSAKAPNHINETLSGMATPNDSQPGDLFSKFAQAMNVLGDNMGVGPLQDQLKKQGINWKKSDDSQSIILYVVNAQTKAPQPIARISASTLEKPSDFETQLLNIMDFAKGDAPGTFKQKQQELQNQEKAAREVARQLGPQKNNIAQQMQEPQAPQQAAAQAAMPKQQTQKPVGQPMR